MKVAGGAALSFLPIPLLYIYSLFQFLKQREQTPGWRRSSSAASVKALTAEKWQTFISSSASALQCHGGRFKM